VGEGRNEPATDRFGGREPTSHERRFDRPWDASYTDGPAPWDLGRPQPAIAQIVASGAFVGTVLDVGCGSGENALLIASSGLRRRASAGMNSAAIERAAAASRDERQRYLASLASVTEHGATLQVLCFSDAEPGPGPHPVSRGDLAAAFRGGDWDLVAVGPERIETRFAAGGVPAWLARAERV
jgi:SAM-dependent methyltransferase